MINKRKTTLLKNRHGFTSLLTFTDWHHSNINHPMLHTNHSTRHTIRQQSQHMEYKIQFQQLQLLPQLRIETCCYCGYLLYNLRQIYRGLVVGSWRLITTNLGQWYCCATSILASLFRYFHLKNQPEHQPSYSVVQKNKTKTKTSETIFFLKTYSLLTI